MSRRGRPAKAPLSREAIVATALEVLGRHERITLRRIAAELDTGPASLYAYYENLEDLYADVLDELLGRLDLGRGRSPWRTRLTRLLTAYTEALTAHPELARTALVTRPNGVHALQLWETLLGLLDEACVPSRDAAWAVDLLLQRATATAAEQGSRARAPGARAEDARVARAVDAVSPRTHPHIAASAGELHAGPPSARLAWGFDVLVNGILATPRPDLPTRASEAT